MDKEILQEIKKVYDAITEVSVKLSNFYNDRHAESQEGINNNLNGLFDIAEAVSDNRDGEYDIAQIVSDLSDQVSALQEEVNALKNNATEEKEDA